MRMETGQKPRKYSIALCGKELVGLITDDEDKPITYQDGTKGLSWSGVQLTVKSGQIGDPWTSRNPKVLGHLQDLEKSGLYLAGGTHN